MISGFATMTLGRDVRTANLGLQKHFENIPQCPDEMFNRFSCFAGLGGTCGMFIGRITGVW